MTDCDDTPPQIHSWHLVCMTHLLRKDRWKLVDWIESQPGGKFYWTVIGNFWFENEEDALKVVLTWK